MAPTPEETTDLEPERMDALDDRLSAVNRPGRSVEACEEAVTRGVHLLAAEANELPSHELVVPLQQVAPSTVA